MDDVLDRHVPRIDEQADWDDVLRRAKQHRRPRRRLLIVTAAVVAAFVVAPALAVMLRDRDVHLPSGADRSNVVVIMQPTTGRILIEVAPWKGHDGFCYLIGWSFDPRVRTGTAITIAGKHVRLTVQHFGGRVDATLFLVRDRLPRFLRTVVLRDAAGNVVARLHVSH
jgi:hypothetical protein